jgi:hypothetical protein
MGDKIVTIGGRATYDIVDDDTMADDLTYAIPTQQSVKAYVDTAVDTASAATTAAVRNYVELKQVVIASGAVTPGVNLVQLNKVDAAMAVTIADLAAHPGLLTITNVSATGDKAHTVTATKGTFDGTNDVLTLDALNESIVLWIDATGAGTVVLNSGAVALSKAG